VPFILAVITLLRSVSTATVFSAAWHFAFRSARAALLHQNKNAAENTHLRRAASQAAVPHTGLQTEKRFGCFGQSPPALAHRPTLRASQENRRKKGSSPAATAGKRCKGNEQRRDLPPPPTSLASMGRRGGAGKRPGCEAKAALNKRLGCGQSNFFRHSRGSFSAGAGTRSEGAGRRPFLPGQTRSLREGSCFFASFKAFWPME